MESWTNVPEMFRSRTGALPPPYEELFGPLRGERGGEVVAVGQLGQSLDGRIATQTGHSHYINGPEGLAHLHRLRALVDAVVIGIGTALADDPQLTVRRVSGPNPARVVIDPRGRLPKHARLLADDGVRRIAITANGVRPDLPPGVEIVELPGSNGAIAPSAILAALGQRGFKRILIEGGADTVSRFLAAGCLNRLHVVVAPIVLGSGRTGLSLPPIARADEALRMKVRVHRLGEEVLFDCDLSAQRAALGSASPDRPG
jgi:diaminohydroxyphosphoribosylaminopyrimidine deaminase / 5-amino-6-(5-phosphoribosylamino)uracil reductase